jgi:polyvinyl alcohol dehydrogenase (cytochrome)
MPCVLVGPLRIVFLATLAVAVASPLAAAEQGAPDGEQLYRQHCARCHEGNMPALLMQNTIRELSAGRIYEALNFFIMQRYGAPLTQAEKRAVAEFAAGEMPGTLTPPLEQIPQSAYCTTGGALSEDPLDGPGWNGWSPGFNNTRFQPAAVGGLTGADLSDLQLKWAFGVPGAMTTSFQATVVGGRVLMGTSIGPVYALDVDSGCIHWVYEADVAVRAALSVGPGANGQTNVYFGDVAANVYAVDFQSGEARWKVEVDDHPDARITGAPVVHDGRLYVPVASVEEGPAGWPRLNAARFAEAWSHWMPGRDARRGRPT